MKSGKLIAVQTSGIVIEEGEVAAFSAKPTGTRARLHFERAFFSGMAVLILLSVFVGFAPTFFLRGIVKIPAIQRGHMSIAQPLSALDAVHGAIFSSWILLLITQTFLVAAHRVRLHRQLGPAGFVLACLVVLIGFATVSEGTARLFPPGDPGIAFFAGAGLFSILGFALLACFSYLQLRNPPAHKRLMLLATICLLGPAFVRWPVWPGADIKAATLSCYALIALIACYDLWSTRNICLATLWGGAVMILTSPLFGLICIIHNPLWFHVALRLQLLGRYLY